MKTISNDLFIKGQSVETVGDVFKIAGGVLYFIDENGIEVEDDEKIMPNNTKVINVRNIKNDEYEITVKLING